jgi:class 3 adenylate cyclase
MLAAAVAEVFTRVEAMGGTVTAASGAGLAALFGAPVAHEDDPERAVRAALQAVSGASPATHGIRRRAGVETGPAVVGLIGGISSGH